MSFRPTALEEAAIEGDLHAVSFDDMHRAGDFLCWAGKSDFHRSAMASSAMKAMRLFDLKGLAAMLRGKPAVSRLKSAMALIAAESFAPNLRNGPVVCRGGAC